MGFEPTEAFRASILFKRIAIGQLCHPSKAHMLLVQTSEIPPVFLNDVLEHELKILLADDEEGMRERGELRIGLATCSP